MQKSDFYVSISQHISIFDAEHKILDSASDNPQGDRTGEVRCFRG